MLDALRGLAQSALGALQTRVQLLADEIEEQGLRIAQVVALCALAGFCLALAVVLGAVLLVVLFWDTHRFIVLGLLCGLFAGGGFAALIAARVVAGARPRALSGTLAELAADRSALEPAEDRP
ncbi:MAG TPA: phage holin family protein [Burkholderiales bacterium]|nr:phage holin family protein [Burkholderiales bacterium]